MFQLMITLASSPFLIKPSPLHTLPYTLFPFNMPAPHKGEGALKGTYINANFSHDNHNSNKSGLKSRSRGITKEAQALKRINTPTLLPELLNKDSALINLL